MSSNNHSSSNQSCRSGSTKNNYDDEEDQYSLGEDSKMENDADEDDGSDDLFNEIYLVTSNRV